jgi:FMN-dependent oxidoreductase (nitrilotriacetate monooxygenase family)
MFHLGWFLGNGFGVQPWNRNGRGGVWNATNGRDWMKPDLYIDLAANLERGGFDFILIEDTSMVEDTYGGSAETTLKYGMMAPKNDPLPLVPLMTRATKHIGIIPTISTIQYPPFLAARLMTTLDHLTEGRVGVNVVTSVSHRVAQNFGYDEHLPHDERYDMAQEWMSAVDALWESWEPDAVRLDDDDYVYADHTKVHEVNFEGKYFRTRGPMNTIPGPQRRPVVSQAGNSIAGRELAARTADTMLAYGGSVEKMKAFREDMHRRAIAHGRNPADLKIMYLVNPVIGETDSDAHEREDARAAFAATDDAIIQRLWNMSYVSGGEVDFSLFNLDEEIPDVIGNGEQSSMANYVAAGKGKSLRELAATHRTIPHLGFVGSADTVAAQMGEIMDEVGGDGYLLYPTMTRRSIVEIADGLGTALKRRGLIRDGYSHSTLRENLLEF